MPRVAALLALVVLLPALSGCFGGQARTEWAFEVTQLSTLAGEGRSGKGVVVAILDTGINRGHVALSHLFDGSKDNGEVVAFKDYINHRDGVSNAYDDDGHGSHVAGIIAASGSSLGDKLVYGGIDLLGGSPGVQLAIAKVCPESRPNDPQPCDSDAIVDAVKWAVAQHAQIINLSLGGNQTVFSNTILDDLSTAVSDAVDHGVVVVAAAGNEGSSAGDVAAPGDIPRVLSVGAVQKDGTVWDLSSRGSDGAHPCIHLGPVETGRCDYNKKPELVAPGVDILSAWKGDGYATARGTSQATPFVTAAVALMLEGRGHLTNGSQVDTVKEALLQNTRPVPGQHTPHDDAAGYGLLQAKNALEHYRG